VTDTTTHPIVISPRMCIIGKLKGLNP